MRKIVLLAAVVFICNTVNAQKTRAELFDSIFTAHYNKKQFNGNVLIAEKGVPIFKKSYGLANLQTKAMLDENSVFELASVSKQFTAMAIMMLHERKKLNLGDPLSKYIPQLSFYKDVTLRQIVHHTGGIPDYESLFDSLWSDKTKIATNEDIISLLATHKPAADFTPGSKWQYSNTGYALLAAVIERASGMSYADFLQQNIFTPLQMNRTSVYRRRYEKKTIDNYAYGYVSADAARNYRLPDELPDYNYVIYLDGIVGDGTVNSTVNDLLKWDQALYTDRSLPAELMKQIFTPGTLSDGKATSYGFGWMISESNGKVASHTGGWPGYRTYISRDMESNKTIILLTNMENPFPPMTMVRNILLNRMNAPAFSVPEEILNSYIGRYKLAEDFILTITEEGSQLFVQATGQQKLRIWPKTNTMFVLKEVEAQIEFIKENGKTTKLVLHQGGRQEAVKMD